MKVHVTSDDIVNGMPLDEEDCPIARAIRRCYPDDYPMVFDSSVHLVRSELVLTLPEEAQAFIREFDLGHAVESFEFEV
jgi:hypothetical protein